MDYLQQHVKELKYKNYYKNICDNDSDGEEMPQSLFCTKILAADIIKPNNLKSHLEGVDAECVRMTPEYSREN
jgi:hypothetical protein